MNIQRCSKSVLDNIANPEIVFDKDGVSNFYAEAERRYENYVFTEAKSNSLVQNLVNEIKKSGRKSEYDCIIGLSGGVDSSFLAMWAVEKGLRPLVVHFDNGWNSQTAIENVNKVVARLGLDLHTYVVNWDEFADIQRSFFKASVVDVEMVTDNSHKAVVYNLAKQHGIKYNLHGGNYRTENMGPSSWSWNKQDVRNIKDIHKQFGSMKMQSYLHMSDFKWELISRTAYGMNIVKPLNLINYRKDTAIQSLREKLGWEYYGGKHYESVFTKFYQAYYLPQKFHIDKRKVHLSSLILNGEITREAAIMELERPLYEEAELERDKKYVLKKLGFTNKEWDMIMTLEPKAHDFYKSNSTIKKNLKRLYNILNF